MVQLRPSRSLGTQLSTLQAGFRKACSISARSRKVSILAKGGSGLSRSTCRIEVVARNLDFPSLELWLLLAVQLLRPVGPVSPLVDLLGPNPVSLIHRRS